MVESLMQPTLSAATLLRRQASNNARVSGTEPSTLPTNLSVSLVTPSEAANTLKNPMNTMRLVGLSGGIRPGSGTARDGKEIERSALGSLSDTLDALGKPVKVFTPRLDGGNLAELTEVLDRIAKPNACLWDDLVVSSPRQVAFIAPSELKPLREFLPPVSGSWPMADVHEMFRPLAAHLDRLHTSLHLGHGLLADRTVVLKEHALGLTRYGLAELLRLARSDTDWLADESYTAPEGSTGRFGPRADQYSLALLILQAVGAWLPGQRKNRTDRTAVTWTALSKVEAVALQRALAGDPTERFATCTEFMNALEAQHAGSVTLRELYHVEFVETLMTGLGSNTERAHPERFAMSLFNAAKQQMIADDAGSIPVQLTDGRWSLRIPFKWTAGLAELKIAAFCDQYNYNKMQMATDTILLKPKQHLGQSANPVELTIRLPALSEARMVEVQVIGRWLNSLDAHKSNDHVTTMLELIRRTMHNVDDRRKAPRIKLDFDVDFYPITDSLAVGAPIRGRCRDISTTGFQAMVASRLDLTHAFAAFHGVEALAGTGILAKLVRNRSTDTDQVITGWRFIHESDNA